MQNDAPPIVVEQTYQAPIADVWSAITEPNRMRQWYFDKIEDFQPEVGFETEFTIECEDRQFPHVWKVTEVVPGKKIGYDWKYRGYEGDSHVTFELEEQGEATKLTLTHRVLSSFPSDIPEFSRESCEGGWDYFLGQQLKTYLES